MECVCVCKGGGVGGGGCSFCQKCRWQVTVKYTDTHGTVKLKWADHCPRIVRTHQENKVEQFLASAKSRWFLLGDTVLKWSQHVEPACKMEPPQPHHPHHKIIDWFFLKLVSCLYSMEALLLTSSTVTLWSNLQWVSTDPYPVSLLTRLSCQNDQQLCIVAAW